MRHYDQSRPRLALAMKLEVIKVPEMPANAGFGGADGKTLFITARTGLYAVQMKVKGYPSN